MAQIALPKTKHQLVAATSIGVALAVMGIKYVAYLMTGSVALFSDALESIVNVLTAIAALIAIRVGAHPPDRRHPFGHHKAEYFSAVLEGALIIVAALLIFHEAYGALLEPRALKQPVDGLARQRRRDRDQRRLGVAADEPRHSVEIAGLVG